MKCQICNDDTFSIDSNVTICPNCKRLNRCDLFSKLLIVLRDINSTIGEFEVIQEKCAQFNTIIKNYPLFITPLCTFDPEEYDTDRVALHYLRNYVMSEDNNILQKHHPAKIDASNSDFLYHTIAILCRLDIEDGAKELRVRNVIDIVLNAEIYHKADPDLHSCLQWGETWKYFILEQLHDKQSVNRLNAILTVCIHSLSNIINMRIRSIYPKVPGGNDDLRKRLNRIFSPLDVQLNSTDMSTITILWSNTKHISVHSTSSMWLPDCVIPLLPKPDCYMNDVIFVPKATSAASQHPAARSFYILSCFCSATQSALNELVSVSDQQNHSEAEIKKEDTRVPEFRCPKCLQMCNNYRFDWRAVSLFRQNFNGARLTYILIDTTSSMNFNFLNLTKVGKKSPLPRIIQTKEATKELLKEVASAAGPLDRAILTTFDDKIKKPALIPLCKASDIAEESNMALVDAIELSPRLVKTHFYIVLKEIYEMFESQPFLYIDLYVFSDGIDTSPKKNDVEYQALVRGLSEKIGAKCHFLNCGSATEGFPVASWFGDTEAHCPISGGIEEIRKQVRSVYQRDHARNQNMNSTQIRFRGRTLDVSCPSLNTYMTDAEAASLQKPNKRMTFNEENSHKNLSNRHSTSSFINLDDYLTVLSSSNRARSASDMNKRSQSPEVYKIATRHSLFGKPH